MTISLKEIQHLARLSRLQMDDAEQQAFLSDLNRLLAVYADLNAVDTQGVTPLAHPLSVRDEITLRLREDVVSAESSEAVRDELMQNAPAADRGLYLVPKVVE